jgi:hypothetical protein
MVSFHSAKHVWTTASLIFPTRIDVSVHPRRRLPKRSAAVPIGHR